MADSCLDSTKSEQASFDIKSLVSERYNSLTIFEALKNSRCGFSKLFIEFTISYSKVVDVINVKLNSYASQELNVCSRIFCKLYRIKCSRLCNVCFLLSAVFKILVARFHSNSLDTIYIVSLKLSRCCGEVCLSHLNTSCRKNVQHLYIWVLLIELRCKCCNQLDISLFHLAPVCRILRRCLCKSSIEGLVVSILFSHLSDSLNHIISIHRIMHSVHQRNVSFSYRHELHPTNR